MKNILQKEKSRKSIEKKECLAWWFYCALWMPRLELPRTITKARIENKCNEVRQFAYVFEAEGRRFYSIPSGYKFWYNWSQKITYL